MNNCTHESFKFYFYCVDYQREEHEQYPGRGQPASDPSAAAMSQPSLGTVSHSEAPGPPPAERSRELQLIRDRGSV